MKHLTSEILFAAVVFVTASSLAVAAPETQVAQKAQSRNQQAHREVRLILLLMSASLWLW